MIPSGSFQMGDSFREGYSADDEAPVHTVELEAFRINTSTVTSEQVAAFVDATGYRTEAESNGTSRVFHLVVQARPSDVLAVASGSPWWLTVKRADWAHHRQGAHHRPSPCHARGSYAGFLRGVPNYATTPAATAAGSRPEAACPATSPRGQLLFRPPRGKIAEPVPPGGTEPDPRLMPANERTFLAWIRTSCPSGRGIAIEAFIADLFLEPIRQGLAVLLLLLGIMLSAGSAERWLRVERSMGHKAPFRFR